MSYEVCQDEPVAFGRYLLLEQLAKGGMAEVYLARTCRSTGDTPVTHPGRLVAIKRILPDIAHSAQFVDMFLDEARLAGQLSHPNIVPIYELGEASGSYYIAMEFVRGTDLRHILAHLRDSHESLSHSMVAWIALKVCEALAYAHSRRDDDGSPLGLIHRDVSPHNVLIGYDGRVKLIDFGVAKATSQTTTTHTGMLKGKLRYMSPEQARGEKVDRRADLFSLGVCMFELLTGRRLFYGNNDLQVLEKVREGQVRPPSKVREDVPESLEAIVMKALSAEADDRYQRAEEMVQELRAFLRNQRPTFNDRVLADWMSDRYESEIVEERDRLEGYARWEDFTPNSDDELSDADIIPLVTESSGIWSVSEFTETTRVFFRADPDPQEEDFCDLTTNRIERNAVVAIVSKHDDELEESRPGRTMGRGDEATVREIPLVEREEPSSEPPATAGDAGEAQTSSDAPEEAAPEASENRERRHTPSATDTWRPPAGDADSDTWIPAANAARARRRRLVIGGSLSAAIVAILAVVAFAFFGQGPSTGTVQVRIGADGQTARIVVDGQDVGQAPLQLDGLTDGTHTITVHADGFEPVTQQVSVSAGSTTILAWELVRQQLEPPAAPEQTSPPAAPLGALSSERDEETSTAQDETQASGGTAPERDVEDTSLVAPQSVRPTPRRARSDRDVTVPRRQRVRRRPVGPATPPVAPSTSPEPAPETTEAVADGPATAGTANDDGESGGAGSAAETDDEALPEANGTPGEGAETTTSAPESAPADQPPPSTVAPSTPTGDSDTTTGEEPGPEPGTSVDPDTE